MVAATAAAVDIKFAERHNVNIMENENTSRRSFGDTHRRAGSHGHFRPGCCARYLRSENQFFGRPAAADREGHGRTQNARSSFFSLPIIYFS